MTGSFRLDKLKDNFTSLWRKPETRDERVKAYVPEVLEESLAEQRRVLQERTSRDVIVESGQRVLRELENKSPTPSIAPHLARVLRECGAVDVIAQRPLSYLLYPALSASSTAVRSGSGAYASSSSSLPHELVVDFADNFRVLVEEVERTGGSLQRALPASTSTPAAATTTQTTTTTTTAADTTAHDKAAAAKTNTATTTTTADEPADVTALVRVLTAMSLANVHCGDVRNALRCVDAALAHATAPSRVGGLLAMKAGLLVRLQKFADALECAELAIEAHAPAQAFVHGAYALQKLQRHVEARALLQSGTARHPDDRVLADMLASVEAHLHTTLPAPAALPQGSSDDSSSDDAAATTAQLTSS